MSNYNETTNFNELRANSGIGSAVFVKSQTLGKFIIRLITEKVSSPSGDVETIEINPTTTTTTTQINGKEKLNKMEYEVFQHRDNLRILEEMNGKSFDFLVGNHDFTGEKFSGTLTYKNGDRTSGDASKCTISIAPSSKPVYVDNILPLIAPTAKITSAIESTFDLPSQTGTIDIDVDTDPVDATISVKSEDEGTCTATVTGKKVTITGVKSGSAIVVITSTKEKHASMNRSVLVKVPDTTI